MSAGHRIRRIQQLQTAPTPIVRRFGILGEALELRTNDERIVALSDAAFGRFEVPADARPVVLRLVVDTPDGAVGRAPAGPADPRALVHDTAGHLFSISLGHAGRAVVDLDAGFATAVLAPALLDAPDLVRYAFLEAAALAMLTGGRGYVPIHAAAVVRDGIGVILQGPAGAGKSTLAMACVRRGFGLLAEDVAFARPDDGLGGGGELELWGLPWTHRLLPDAPRFFPELAPASARLQANGEHKLEIDVDDHAPGAAMPRAIAGPVIILARDTGGPTRLERLDPASDPTDVEVLWPWDGRWTPDHQRTAERLLEAGVARLHVNGSPDEAVDALAELLAPAAVRGA